MVRSHWRGTPPAGDQLSIFDARAAGRAKQRGMAAAVDAADQVWRENVESAILQLASSGLPFISDDVRRLAGDPPPGTSPNSMGAIISAARAAGRIRMAGWGKSSRVVGHGNDVRQWVGV